MNIGKKNRLQRIFENDGRALILDADAGSHPLCLESEAVSIIDGLILTPGLLNSAQKKPPHRCGLIIRVPARPPSRNYPLDPERRITRLIEMAVRCAADAIAVLFEPVIEEQKLDFEWVSIMADICLKWGLPVMLEAVPDADDLNGEVPVPADLTCRAADAGVDVLSLSSVGLGAGFEKKTGWPIPVLMVHRGGETSDQDVFEFTSRAMESGASGVVLKDLSWTNLEKKRIQLQGLADLVHKTRS